MVCRADWKTVDMPDKTENIALRLQILLNSLQIKSSEEDNAKLMQEYMARKKAA